MNLEAIADPDDPSSLELSEVEQPFREAPSESQKGYHVLVTGGAGYIGSTMAELLLERGYAVTVVDRFTFGDSLADLRDSPHLRTVRKDVRDLTVDDFETVDAVFDLAAMSNDPSGELNPSTTLEINHRARRRTARLAKRAGVDRYQLASSCSIYGNQEDLEGELADESSEINPLTTYAECNRLAEVSNLPLGDDDFTTTALRQATVFGLSRRMRFDLVINAMVKHLFQKGELDVMRPGTQWRPLVHVRDTCRAFIQVMETDKPLVNRQIFNVGDNDLNVQIQDLARTLSEAVGHDFELSWYGDPDDRSYRVDFSKIQENLGYGTKETFESGAREIYNALEAGSVRVGPTTNTVGWYKGWREADISGEEG